MTPPSNPFALVYVARTSTCLKTPATPGKPKPEAALHRIELQRLGKKAGFPASPRDPFHHTPPRHMKQTVILVAEP